VTVKMYLLLNHSFKRFIKKTLIHPVMKQVKYFLNESLNHSFQPTQRKHDMIQVFKFIYSFIQCNIIYFSVTHNQYLDYSHLLASNSTFSILNDKIY